MPLNIKRKGTSIFVALPIEARRAIAGGCQCPYCIAHPEKTPMWDTISMCDQRPDHAPDTGFTVHYPELANS